MKRITIKDIAKELNVSVATVSRAFNDKYDIKKETRDLILETAKKMRYSPNPIAKKLNQRKTFNIGVIVPEIINEFFSEIIIAIQEVFITQGYQILVMQSDENSEQELRNVQTLIDNMVDGLIIAPTNENDNMSFYLEQIKEEYPIVFLGRVAESLPASKVLFNNQKWSFFATEHLIKQGYKKIYHLAGHKDLCVSNERIKGFIKALEKHDFPKKNYKIFETGLSSNEGIQIIENLMASDDLPEAIYCENDLVALGVIKKLKDNGFKIPEDIAIIGFTETRMAQLTSPALTSVKQPTFEMGKQGANLLLEQISTKSFEPTTIVLEGQLNIRQSSIKA